MLNRPRRETALSSDHRVTEKDINAKSAKLAKSAKFAKWASVIQFGGWTGEAGPTEGHSDP
jgi:hypothetical protein